MFVRTTFVLRREKFGSHLVVDSNLIPCKLMTAVSNPLYKLPLICYFVKAKIPRIAMGIFVRDAESETGKWRSFLVN